VPKPKKVRFTESHRLAYLVANIDREVSVVPRGAYVVTPTHYIIRNAAYEGACYRRYPRSALHRSCAVLAVAMALAAVCARTAARRAGPRLSVLPSTDAR
jgi:hypothetical protein